MLQAELIPHREIVAFVRERGLHGRGAGWIDIHLLASAKVERLRFWTADSRLEALARELASLVEAWLPSTSSERTDLGFRR